MNFSAWAVRNPLPSLLLFAVLCGLGAWSFPRLPITYFPVLDMPGVQVTVTQDGAAPEQMETEVAMLLEDAIAALPDIDEMETIITQGEAVTTVEFALSVPADRAMSDVRDAVAAITDDLPEGIDDPLVERTEEDEALLVSYALSAPDMIPTEASWYVDNTLARILQGVPGVGRIERIGGAAREVQVLLDPARMEALGLTAEAVTDALARDQIAVPGGRSGALSSDFVLTVDGRAGSLSDLSGVLVAAPGGGAVRLGDVAEIRDTGEDTRSFATLDGRDMVGFSVFKTRTASDVAVAEGVAERLHEIAAANPRVDFTLVEDTVSFTEGNFEAAMHTLEEGAVLAIVVVLLFLKDWRATLVAAVALPLSVIPTFFVLHQLGFSLNILSLLGITLVTGILVDDAIVVIENIVRHRGMGKSAWRAALDASGEIGLAVLAISATIIAVFAPVAFIPGEIGQYFREFGLTVAIAVFFSLLVAQLITPLLAAYVMRGGHAEPEPGVVIRTFRRFVGLAVRWRLLTIGASFAGLFASLVFLAGVPGAFLPAVDTGRATVTLELPPGSPLERTRAASDRAVALLRALPEVSSVLVRGGGSEVAKASLSVNFIPKAERLSVEELEPELRAALAPLPDARVEILQDGNSRDLSFGVMGRDGAATEAAARAILAVMEADPAFLSPISDIAAPQRELELRVASDRAADLGVPAAAIARTIRVSTIGASGSELPGYLDGARQIPIRVMLSKPARDDLDALKALQVPGASGVAVPLAAVAEFGITRSVASLSRFDRRRRIELSADMAEGLGAEEGLARVRAYPEVAALSGDIGIMATGDVQDQGDTFAGFLAALIAGLVMVFVVLVLLFGSLFTPVTVLAALPLSLVGVAVALWVSGAALSLSVVIGILMLAGIVTKNSIMLVDFAVVLEREGLAREAAAIEAAATRLRPIVMTTLAMVAGMVPAAMGVGMGGEFRAPMAVVVIGGLISSTLLSLVVIPALHVAVADAGQWVGGRLPRMLGLNRAETEAVADQR